MLFMSLNTYTSIYFDLLTIEECFTIEGFLILLFAGALTAENYFHILNGKIDVTIL